MINWVDFIAGWIGGVAGLTVGHPFDTIKVRQQIHSAGFIESAQKTYVYEGYKGFFKGLTFPVMTIGPSNAALFGVYGNFMRLTAGLTGSKRVDTNDPHWQMRSFLGGCTAGIVVVTLLTPVEYVKTQLQLQTEHQTSWKSAYETHYKGIWDCLKKVTIRHGLTGLYRGYVPFMARDGPTTGLYTVCYETMIYYKYPIDILNQKLIKQIIAGGTAGVLSWLPVIPFDVVKSRIQGDDPDNPKYSSMINCFYKSYKEEGLSVFMKGSTAVLFRGFTANAVVFIVYERVLEYAS